MEVRVSFPERSKSWVDSTAEVHSFTINHRAMSEICVQENRPNTPKSALVSPVRLAVSQFFYKVGYDSFECMVGEIWEEIKYIFCQCFFLKKCVYF